MLKSLRIQNLALIDDLILEFGSGLNLLTGETGSGKSIIVDSLALILGKRAGSEMIRGGAEVARVEAVVDVGGEVARRLQEAGIEAGDGSVIFRRELSRASKGRAWLNESPVTFGFLQELAPLLADIHGQQDQQLLQRPGLQLELLDAFAGSAADVGAAQVAYGRLSGLRERLRAADMAESERQKRVELLQFQIREIGEARLQPGEEEELLRERNLLLHGEELLRLSQEIYEWIYNRDDSALSLLARASRNLQRLVSIDPGLRALEPSAQNARFALEEFGCQMRDYAEAIDFDPSRLQQLELRLDRIDRFKKKYAPSIAQILELLQRLTAEHAELVGWEENRQRLAGECSAAEQEYRETACRLSQKRKAAAQAMQRAMEAELRSLAMEKSRFVVAIRPGEESARGSDSVEFLVSPNVGEEPRPLAKIASGGELSRLMLALKTSLHVGGGELMVFDEIDSGIGGRVAETVGLKLKRLASRQQVFCVTHLPQIAAFADIHYRVGKQVRGGRTVVAVERLDDQGKLEEVARMLAGSRIGKSALEHARSLIARSSA
ncbi:MAG: DNA repair protein RecN [Acidobacteria bacterium]|nr:DNA repair protein RecN [Acidobacteriota bacterium]